MSPRSLRDTEGFAAALRVAGADTSLPQGIGRLNEGSLHKTLKFYLEPDKSRHEVRVGPYFADILNGDGVTEIQTRALGNLSKKLEAFLDLCAVTVVFPVAVSKTVVWLDPKTGELSPPRKSPKKGSEYDVFFELYRIRSHLSHPRLRVRVMFMRMTDVRLLCGRDPSKKKGSRRFDRLPEELLEDLVIDSPQDYSDLLPKGLPEGEFTSGDMAALCNIKPAVASCVMGVLASVGLVSQVGKRGRSNLYVAQKGYPNGEV